MFKKCHRLFLLLVAIWLTDTLSIRAEEVDLELVLAVDGSGSISSSEFQLQLEGYAAAFRNPELQGAIRSGPVGKIAVSMMIWSDAVFPKFPTEWHIIASPEDANRFAYVVENFYQHSGRNYGIGGGGTSIGDGIAFAIKMIDENGHSGLRRVIDVSGDGIETDPMFGDAVLLPDAREAAQLHGININGLAILTDFFRLDEWYRNNVIQGPGSFVVEAENFEIFGEAIHEKLFREVSVQISESPMPVMLENSHHASLNYGGELANQ